MAFDVLVSEDAQRDIEDIYRDIASADSPEKAERVFLALEQLCCSLSEFPDRGNVPKELLPLGMTEFREAHYKPYRVIYRGGGHHQSRLCRSGRRPRQPLSQACASGPATDRASSQIPPGAGFERGRAAGCARPAA